MKPIARVRPGQPITADWANQVADVLNKVQGMSVAPPLQLQHQATGLHLGLAAPIARISLFKLDSRAGTTPGDGSDPEDVSFWRARQLVFDESDGIYEPSLPTASSTNYTHLVYDPLRVLATASVAEYHPAFFNPATGHWELLPGFVGAKWAKAKERWQNTNNPYVTCNPCTDYQGTNVDTTTSIVVALPRVNGRGDPNVRTNNVIAYMPVGGTGTPTSATLLCISNYLDDKLGTIKLYSGSLIFIPPGWALCDGTANSNSNGGSGVNLSGRFVVGYSESDPDYTTMWNSGGSKTHSHPSPGSHNHTIPYTTVGVTPGGTNIASVSMVATGSTSIPATNTVDHRPPYFTLAYIERVL